ncbi:MAG TPA: hypothetical protein VGG05_03050 [Pseudonocardiaceae bacterium]
MISWVAVAVAINRRMVELDRKQSEVVRRSGLARQAVGEIQYNTIQPRRSPRTLEAISRALNWHPGHLTAVLEGRTPPELGEPFVRSAEDVTGRLAAIDYRLHEIAEDGRVIKSVETRPSGLAEELAVSLGADQPGDGRSRSGTPWLIGCPTGAGLVYCPGSCRLLEEF